MVTPVEIGTLLIVIFAAVVAYRAIKAIKPFLWNAVVGVVVLVLVELAFGIEVAITPLVLLVVAIGGLPGAILVMLLAVLEVAFVPGTIVLIL